MSLPPPPDPPGAGEPGGPSRPALSDVDRRAIRRRVRTDQLKTVGLILGISGLIIAGTVAAALWGAAGLYLTWLSVGIVVLVGWLVQRQRSDGEAISSVSSPGPMTTRAARPGEATFTDIAFSENRPTWRGWRRDVGVARIRPDQVTIVGLKGQLTIRAPFEASVEQIKYCYWPLVEVTGSIGSDRETKALLAVRGYPLSKFAAKPEEIAREANALAMAINSARGVGG